MNEAITERTFHIQPEEQELAEQILAETTQFGGDISRFQIEVQDPHATHGKGVASALSLFSYIPYEDGIEAVRHECRLEILVANGADPSRVGVQGNYYSDKEKVFGMSPGQIYPFCVIRGIDGEVIAQGRQEWLTKTPLVERLLSLRLTGRSWDAVMLWNLGFPARIAEKRGNRLMPKAEAFLFHDEWETLEKEKRVLTFNLHTVYDEHFEGFVIDQEPAYGWETLFKVRARLLD